MTRQRSNATTTTIMSRTQQPLVERCEQCGSDVVMVTPEYAVAVLRFPPDKLFAQKLQVHAAWINSFDGEPKRFQLGTDGFLSYSFEICFEGGDS